MRGTLRLLVPAIALTLIAAASLVAFVSELLGPRRISGLIAFVSIFLASFYPVAVVAAFLVDMSLSTRRSQRELARKQRSG